MRSDAAHAVENALWYAGVTRLINSNLEHITMSNVTAAEEKYTGKMAVANGHVA